jgi:MoxR-like ATPase
MTDAQALHEHLDAALGREVVGLEHVRRLLTVALLTRGHVLIEGAPGLGKTLLARTFARALGGEFQRIQGTADLMPSDLTGQNVFDQRSAQFSFRPGPLFADVVLADEINRAGPKTQSALLEAMAERQVTVDRVRHALPKEFLVIATQNPHEFEGTYPLPESQLDRFMFSIAVSHPDRDAERDVLRRYDSRFDDAHDADVLVAPVPDGLIAAARAEAGAIHVADSLHDYALDIVRATREHPSVALGVSTRGLLALVRAARGSGAVRGAQYVTPDDVKELAVAVLAHRLVLRPEASLEGRSNVSVLEDVLARTPVPR